jgi:thiamine-phosphate pyrophosphorylase
MEPSPYTGIAALASQAAQIAATAPKLVAHLGPLMVLTDPVRLPDPVSLAAHLPPGSVLIYRHFGDPKACQLRDQASALCHQRGVSFLVSCDSAVPPGPKMGVHFPEHMHGAIADWREAMVGHIFTAAAHSVKSANAALAAGADAVLLSPVFGTACESSGAAMGAADFAQKCKAIHGPVYGLGGITAENATALQGYVAGIAAVSAILAPTICSRL